MKGNHLNLDIIIENIKVKAKVKAKVKVDQILIREERMISILNLDPNLETNIIEEDVRVVVGAETVDLILAKY